MRIAYVAVKGLPIGGGIEKLTEEIGSRLARKGHRIIVYSSRDYGTSDGIYRGMEVRTVSSFNTRAFHKLSICYNAIRDILRRRDVDIVHVHAVGSSLFSIFPRMKNIPTVVQTHGIEWMRDKWVLWEKLFSDWPTIRLYTFRIEPPRSPESKKLIMKRGSAGKSFTYLPV